MEPWVKNIVLLVLLLLFIVFLVLYLWTSVKSDKRLNLLRELSHKYRNLEWERDNLKANLEKTSIENIKRSKLLDEYKKQFPDFKPTIKVEENFQSSVADSKPIEEGSKSNEANSQLNDDKEGKASKIDESIPPVEEEPSPVITFDLNNKSESVTYYYLKDAFKGKFSKKFTEPYGCYFRCWEKDGKLLFEFCGDQEKAIKNVNAYFDDVCLLKGVNPYQANAIVNLEPGILDENLSVIEKAVVNLISK